ncbi:MAG TPA: LytTR family DNA-binding domain-containing protein [Aquabacterium sp.]|uniref:LytR/AlgR family response regulator transcription factor n=1 Tax=Aquabacterium sp. TaxID=1872578 RepID=UPI002E314E73|nr:LytTR family DNA-binding domain-containing protein [Aquabacterium sp.]HEX5356120.1 LytTR family DNA-binding domain-containing protein [Aquabacterium sp.]
MNPVTALIAEDEPVLASALQRQLARLWPDLRITQVASDGLQACQAALSTRPDVLFLDIHMPGASGLEVAERVIEDWPADHPLPLIVFITAYDHHAVAAFEHAAIDYVLKPIRAERLAVTCLRVQQQLNARRQASVEDALPHQLMALRQAQPASPAGEEPLRVLQAAAGTNVYVIPLDDIIYLEAADKYVRIVTQDSHPGTADKLIRTPLKELLPRLDQSVFWQIHRSHVVNVRAIDRVSRQLNRTRVHLKNRTETLDVSRMYTHLFKAM